MELSELKGLGPKTLEKLNKLGIKTAQDLILLEPAKYLSLELVTTIKEEEGLLHITDIQVAKLTKMPNKSLMLIFIATFLGKRYRFIIFTKEYLEYVLRKNKDIYVYAKYVSAKNYFLVSKIFVTKPQEIKVLYKIKGINDANLSKLIYQAFLHFTAPVDRLPENLVQKYQLLPYSEYLLTMHFPQNQIDLKQIYRRKTYERFFWRSFFTEVLAIRSRMEKKPKVFAQANVNNFIAKFPFDLTIDQKATIKTILTELASSKRINRLVEGDVGSGKTVVALVSAYATLLSGYQVVFIAPTVILANQHYELAKKYFKEPLLLTSNLKTQERSNLLKVLASEKPVLVIGTHALLQDSVVFAKLGLVIIDEQQRFGVLQRSLLQKRYPTCDTLYFTATPIPRSLALTAYKALDLSLIKTKPQGRQPVLTKLVPETALESLMPTCQARLNQGEQMFVVCSVIKAEEDNLWDLATTKAFLTSHLDASIGIIHGQMKDKEKLEIIQNFNQKKLNVLVATTIIEVGIDIKNATTLILLDANRYGLATIHQLRGRVGRGNLAATFYVVSQDIDNERLKILETVNDGFALAEYDLKLRGPGEFLGRSQSGFVDKELSDLESKIYQIAATDAKWFAKYVTENNLDDKYKNIMLQISAKEHENN